MALNQSYLPINTVMRSTSVLILSKQIMVNVICPINQQIDAATYLLYYSSCNLARVIFKRSRKINPKHYNNMAVMVGYYILMHFFFLFCNVKTLLPAVSLKGNVTKRIQYAFIKPLNLLFKKKNTPAAT